VAVDHTFGDVGTIWTSVPHDLGRPHPFDEPVVYYTGGTAVGLHLASVGPMLAASGQSDPETTPLRTEVFAVHFPPDGRPAAEGMAAGTYRTLVSPEGTLLGACDSPAGGMAMLLRVGKAYKIVTVDRVPGSFGQVTADVPISSTWLFEPSQRGSVRLLAAGGTLVIASTRDDRLRVAAFFPAGRPFNLFTTRIQSKLLKGLTRLDVASVQYDIPGWLFIALTAQLDPRTRRPSAAAILRVNYAGTRDPSYGEDGLWVSPRTPPKLRQFIAAGTWPGGLHHLGGVVGIDRTQMVAIGVAPDGDALDNTFASNGILRRSLGGGALSSPVTASSGQYTYLFAARDDGRVVGCRFSRQGVLDTGFGDAGLATIPSGTEELALADLKVTATRLALAVTRRADGIDCDRVPAAVMLNPTTGQPDGSFGAGGFVFHAAVGEPAVVCPNGVAYYTERRTLGETMTLRRTDPEGRLNRAITLPAPIAGFESFFALDDSSVLVGSSAYTSAWVGKLTAAGDPDPSFGTNGFAIPGPGTGPLQILGLRPDGKIAVVLEDKLGVLDPTSGALDTTYGTNDPNSPDPNPTDGLVIPWGITYPSQDRDKPLLVSSSFPFLDADGSVLLAIASRPQYKDDNPVELALRRITPSGMIDPGFGIGVPSLVRPTSDQFIRLAEVGGSGPLWYWRVEPVGLAWIAGMLYVVAQGVTEVAVGGAEVKQLGTLVVTRWTAQGRVDSGFGNFKRQEAGHTPVMLDYKPAGVLVLPPVRAGVRHGGNPELIVFGTAGGSPTAGGPPIPRRPEPAFWRVSHPEGIAPGQPEFCQMQEFQAWMVAARILPPAEAGGRPRLRFVCADRRGQPDQRTILQSNFGGVGQFTIERGTSISLFPGPDRTLPRT
jgi:hypothetical protein